ncbi:MAG TPA: hypothetical protein VFS21_12670 [Roseiflexaceae bacterium]|nr:hypothetical protein [Roseiflexaceae bacterium]
MATAQSTTRRALRWLRQFGRRLRHNSVALLALLVLGLGEPLICIIHCDVWMPLMAQAMLHSGAPDPHAHHAHQHIGAHHNEPEPVVHRGEPASIAAQPAPVALSGHPMMLCTMRPGDSGPSPLVPLSPLHELLLVVATLFGVLLLPAAYRLREPLPPLFRAYPPPLPPPVVV